MISVFTPFKVPNGFYIWNTGAIISIHMWGLNVCLHFCCVYGAMLRYSTLLKRTISARNSTVARAQDFVENEELLLPILKAFCYWTRSLHAT
jgi:hypothetical protein